MMIVLDVCLFFAGPLVSGQEVDWPPRTRVGATVSLETTIDSMSGPGGGSGARPQWRTSDIVFVHNEEGYGGIRLEADGWPTGPVTVRFFRASNTGIVIEEHPVRSLQLPWPTRTPYNDGLGVSLDDLMHEGNTSRQVPFPRLFFWLDCTDLIPVAQSVEERDRRLIVRRLLQPNPRSELCGDYLLEFEDIMTIDPYRGHLLEREVKLKTEYSSTGRYVFVRATMRRVLKHALLGPTDELRKECHLLHQAFLTARSDPEQSLMFLDEWSRIQYHSMNVAASSLWLEAKEGQREMERLLVAGIGLPRSEWRDAGVSYEDARMALRWGRDSRIITHAGLDAGPNRRALIDLLKGRKLDDPVIELLARVHDLGKKNAIDTRVPYSAAQIEEAKGVLAENLGAVSR